MTRAAVLERATALGSREGLVTLSIGRIAQELGLSKGGVIGHFGSKEQLQLAAVEVAVARFRDEVWAPASGEPSGLARLRTLMDNWISYLERRIFPGGCFLTAVSSEFDDRPGSVRDAVAGAWRRWLFVLEGEVAEAQARGQLVSELSPSQITFQLHAFVSEANWAMQLFRDPGALTNARAAISALLTEAPYQRGG